MTPAPATRALATRPGPAPVPKDPGPAPAPTPRPEPGRCASADLDPSPASAANARRVTRDALTRWNLQALTDDALTITSELAANAIAATPPGSPAPAIILTLHYQPPDLTIRMWDTGPGEPSPATPGDDAEDGRGLILIDHLSNDWGWWPCPRSGGKVVFATLTAKDTP
ncbi:MAG TPA: ATP-binding protein [Trebonia sp.]|nr:ATP-binding protein [Trebonia sp.]